MKLDLRLFKKFVASRDDVEVELQNTQAQLLALLALNLGSTLSRQRAAGLLWPDLPEARARANLSTVAWRLKCALSAKTFAANVFRSTDKEIWLEPDNVRCDVAEFLKDTPVPGARSGSLEALTRAVGAIELYRGDLLEDWDFEWCGADRQHLRERCLEILAAVSEGFERRGRPDLALPYVKRALVVDPFNESLQRGLIRLHARLGDRATAVSHFRKFSQLVKDELGVEPDHETVMLVEEIRRSPVAFQESQRHGGLDPLLRSNRVPLVGRQSERQSVVRALESGLGGKGRSVLLVGESGVGKSRIAEWTLEEWIARGGITAHGRCIEFNEPVPYQPILDALGRFVSLKDMEQVAPVQPDVLGVHAVSLADESPASSESRERPQHPGRLRLFAWLRDRLGQIAADRPLLLVLEDMHWADTSTIDFVAYISEHCRRLRVVLLVTSRSAAPRRAYQQDLNRLMRHATDICTVGPLSQSESAELVRSLLGRTQVDAETLFRIHRETEGNPLFIVETLRLMQQNHWQEPRESTASMRSPDETDALVFQSVRALIEQRLALLSGDGLNVAGIASVVGRSVDPELLGAIARMNENKLSKAIAELLAHGILDRDRTRLRFSHDKIRAVCYERLSPQARRGLHARCAHVLAAFSDNSSHTLAWHQQSAGQWSLAASSWRDAADRAREVHAYDEAARAYENALVSTRRDRTVSAASKAANGFGILHEYATVLAVLGRPKERARALAEMGRLCDKYPRETARAAWLVQRALLEDHLGNHSLAVAVARRAWSIVCLERRKEDEPRALRVLAWALNRASRPRRSLAVSRIALRKVGTAASVERARILAEAASALVKLYEYTTALAWIREARICLAEIGHEPDASISIAEAMVRRWVGDLIGARRSAQEAVQLTRETGNPSLEGRGLYQLATISSLEGRLGTAIPVLRRARLLLRAAADSRMFAACLNEVAYGIGRQIGNYGWAWAASELALRQQHGGAYGVAAYRDSQAQLLVDQGLIQEARVKISEVLGCLEQSFRFTTQHLESLARRGAILLQLGEIDQAYADLSTAAAEQRSRGERLLLPNTLTYLALVYAERGDAEQAIATSDEAISVLTAVNFANHQPQRIFWHHHLLLTRFGREPRLPPLHRAVELVEAQAATLSNAQQRRFRREVPLNRSILEAWRACGQPATVGRAQVRSTAHAAATPAPA
ncbi:MAG: AAA family ATPase [Armatimonadota bacterium]|nr:AAA family ATPase [Armatimonadota bacterium]